MPIDTEFVKGADKLKARIATIRAKLDLPAMEQEIGALLLRRTIQRFDREVDPDERPWEPLAPATIARKKRLGYGERGKLQRTRSMRNAIRLIRGGRDTIYSNTGAGVRIGIQESRIAEYARIQNNGNNRIPARRFLGIGRLDVKAVDSFMRRRASQLEREI